MRDSALERSFSGIDGESTLNSGRYSIDAKSIMGVLTLKLSVPMSLEIRNWKDEYMEMLKPYLI